MAESDSNRQGDWEERLRELQKLGVAWLAADYQLADRIRQLVDTADDDDRDEVRQQIAELREERLKMCRPLLEPYRLSLLVRHTPHLDDWDGDYEVLEQVAMTAAEEEWRSITAEMAVPFRLQLLIDSYERIVRRLNECWLSEKKIASYWSKHVREQQEQDRKDQAGEEGGAE
jgi:hypothetical protein